MRLSTAIVLAAAGLSSAGMLLLNSPERMLQLMHEQEELFDGIKQQQYSHPQQLQQQQQQQQRLETRRRTAKKMKEEEEEEEEEDHPALASSSSSDDTTRAKASAAQAASPPQQQKDLPVKWPQSDNRLQRAIQQGERLGPAFPLDVSLLKANNNNGGSRQYYTWNATQYEVPASSTTVVSMFYDISEKTVKKYSGHRLKTEYVEWMTNLMATSTDPLVFFTSGPDSWAAELVRQHRQHAPTILAYIPFEELTTVTNFDESFWITNALEKDHYTIRYVFKRETGQYKLYNEKIILTHEASLVNPFATQHFVWLDTGYFRGGPVNGVLVRNDLTANGLKPNQMALQNVYPKPKGYLLAGGAWGGSATGVQNVYDLYWKTFWYMAHDHPDDLWCVGYEQHVFTTLCKSFPAACSVHHSDHWFEMGQQWLRDPSKTWNRGRITLDPNHDRVMGAMNKTVRVVMPVVPQDLSVIEFPQQFPISAIPDPANGAHSTATAA